MIKAHDGERPPGGRPGESWPGPALAEVCAIPEPGDQKIPERPVVSAGVKSPATTCGPSTAAIASPMSVSSRCQIPAWPPMGASECTAVNVTGRPPPGSMGTRGSCQLHRITAGIPRRTASHGAVIAAMITAACAWCCPCRPGEGARSPPLTDVLSHVTDHDVGVRARGVQAGSRVPSACRGLA
jgi:hypothetical protein